MWTVNIKGWSALKKKKEEKKFSPLIWFASIQFRWEGTRPIPSRGNNNKGPKPQNDGHERNIYLKI